MFVQKIQHKALDIFEYALSLLEKYGGQTEQPQLPDPAEQAEKEEAAAVTPYTRLRHISDGAYRLTLSQSRRSLNAVKATRLYKFTDSYVDFDARCDFLYKVIVLPMYGNFVVVKDTSTQCVSVIVQHTAEQRDRLKGFVEERLPLAKVYFSDYWMRLDFDNDGSVSVEDVKATVRALSEAVRGYGYTQRYLEFRNSMYRKAI